MEVFFQQLRDFPFIALFLIRILFKALRKKVSSNLLLPVLTILLIGINFIIFFYKVPSQLFKLDLFSPYYFAISNKFSSIGHLLVSSVFVFLISYIFYREFNLRTIMRDRVKYKYFYYSLALILGAFFFVVIVYLFKNLIFCYIL